MVDGLSPYAGEQVRFAAAFSASDQNLPVAKARVIFGYFLHPFGRAINREPHSKPVNIEPAQLNRIGSSHCANRTPNPEVQLRKSIRSRFKPAFQMGRKKIGGGRCDQVLRAFRDGAPLKVRRIGFAIVGQRARFGNRISKAQRLTDALAHRLADGIPLSEHLIQFAIVAIGPHLKAGGHISQRNIDTHCSLKRRTDPETM